ncbi:MAG: hypothetical protein COW24_05300 [Candidatus Kerfeldbacteria bacterium CG15_BIG_FIL_POST_REV_8_21_14_020_45_12]|uniref:Uncharacterized protein n=1 Tax=Candidatus Kerfeldbacteria bacterium CG15_BIG_FIL_POST_REV_8_21_14_020_45_12 TaxID=2014247 RepID=A0A2M7H2I9_9BACT|nr:MAG: hypothetical protein COW24_05300 [Candidatus Kerfeldbacteria bacterium CG15_BIG_FIL_POST_REV_8_21_14_020_45_12]PJA93479.1 MAG: hypothetical protein CO132_02515 [Candidatus Kerfeldbacteria bacterium CG_4_9_14_3_um_filter_45_8]
MRIERSGERKSRPRAAELDVNKEPIEVRRFNLETDITIEDWNKIADFFRGQVSFLEHIGSRRVTDDMSTAQQRQLAEFVEIVEVMRPGFLADLWSRQDRYTMHKDPLGELQRLRRRFLEETDEDDPSPIFSAARIVDNSNEPLSVNNAAGVRDDMLSHWNNGRQGWVVGSAFRYALMHPSDPQSLELTQEHWDIFHELLTSKRERPDVVHGLLPLMFKLSAIAADRIELSEDRQHLVFQRRAETFDAAGAQTLPDRAVL